MRKHPVALPFLFLTEMWERFGYYLMIGIFTLYMMDTQKGGLGFERGVAYDIYGTFIALAYLTPFIGGLLADRLLGFRKSIIIGGTLMGIGYLMLAIPNNLTTFYLAIFVMILGNGFFKPNISTLLGNLYNEDKYRSLKDEGYSIFYMGINIGALVCNFVAAYLRNTYGWGYAFAAAGIGMFVGVIVFSTGLKHYKHADVQQVKGDPGRSGLAAMLSSVLLPALATGAAAWYLPGNIFGSDSSDAFLFGSIPVIAFYLWTLMKAAPDEKPRIRALLAVYSVVIVFWAVFKQNGSALTNWAEFYTDRSMVPALETTANFMGATQKDTLKLGLYPIYDEQFRTTKDPATGKPAMDSSYHPYFQNLARSEWPPEGGSVTLLSTEIFQSVNPFFVIVFTPLLIWFFSWLRKRNREPSTPGKIGWGLIISALSTLVTVFAVYACHNGAVKASVWWVVMTYAVITVGELCLSPMGLSMVSKMAPARLAGLMMGGWQLATALGNKISGVLATMWDKYEDKSMFFWVNFALLAISATALFIMLPWLKRIFKEAGVK
ncbi:MAG: peptide MFS transporter [Saprospiraceae bacterium]|nr:peptide MFS transporter [Saprospiraceae bacterium]MCB9343123.1 peptide MFS transporter [Lewinellaceae bacterium]